MTLALLVGGAVCVVLTLMGAVGYALDRGAERHEAGGPQGGPRR